MLKPRSISAAWQRQSPSQSRRPLPFASLHRASRTCLLLAALVIAQQVLVYAGGPAPFATPAHAAGASGENARAATSKTTKPKPAPRALKPSDLPEPVQDMRELILSAVQRGDIEELRHALDWNELRPKLGIDRNKDAIAHFREISADGEGLEILARLADILTLPPVKLPLGADLENNDVFVWPYLAERKPSQLSPQERIDLFRLVPSDKAKTILASDKWSWYRLAIAADGTWHVFAKLP